MDYYTMSVNVKFDVSTKDIDDIMHTAMYDGIGHWCSLDYVKGKGGMFENWTPTYKAIGMGASVLFRTVDDKVRELTTASLLLGIKQYVEENPYCLAEGKIDTGMIDSEAADIIVQYALFGELVYS